MFEPVSPYERIYERARKECTDAEFAARIGWYLHHGFVFSTPDFFIMGRNCWRETLPLVKPDEYFDRMDGDCWYIAAFAGDMSKAWSILPWPLPWIAFQREHAGTKELQFVEISRLKRLTHAAA